MNREALVYPYGEATASALLKSTPQDFQVSEELGFEPSGDGEHLFLHVEKTGLNTTELVSRIAREYAIQPRQISYSGLKDKQAVARQWLSLHLPGRQAAKKVEKGDGFRILLAARHRSKLRRGTHKANSFRLLLREVSDWPASCDEQLDSIARQGFANYFGRQRFGRRQDNVEQALRQLNTARLQRNRRSLLLSSLRSQLFNRILAQRIAMGYWRQPLEGDVFMLRGSHSIFSEALNQELLRRFEALDISSTASLYGAGRNRLTAAAQQIENQVFAEHRDITDCLDKQGLKLQMRALRVAVDDFGYEYDAARRILELGVRLPAGSYMTSLLDHFINAVDAD